MNRRDGVRAALVAILAGIVALLAVSSAAAEQFGPPPAPLQSRCAAMSLSPHVVKVGKKIVGSAGPATDQCGAPGASAVTWGWSVINGVKPVSGCGTRSSSCVLKAIAATTGGWNSGCIDGSSGFGGWTSCDYYAVIGPDQFQLSGRVTLEGSGGKGVSGLRVTATGPGGGSTTTDTDGDYVLVVKRGRYTVSAGSTAKPAQHEVQVSRDTHGVDFEAACGTATTPVPDILTADALPGGDRVARGPIATTAGAGACPLTVTIKALDTPIRTGLHFDRSDNQPAFFDPFTPGVPSADGDGFIQACGSGCSNVLVTVTRANGTAVDDATVKLGIDGIEPENAVFPYPSGQGHAPAVCVVAGTGQDPCASAITATTSDGGQVLLRVWPPGVDRPAGLLLRATAEAHHCSDVCTLAVGNGHKLIKLAPNLIYKARFDLSMEDREAMLQWSGRKRIETDLPLLNSAFDKLFPGVGQVVSSFEDRDDLRIVARFVQGFKLAPDGLLRTTARDYALGLVGQGFEHELIDTLQKYAQYLSTTSDLRGNGIAQVTRLTIYEVSYCDVYSVCANPALGTAPGPFLIFRLDGARDAGDLGLALHSNFVGGSATAVAYPANEWMPDQFR